MTNTELKTFADNVLAAARSGEESVVFYGDRKAFICTVAETMTLAGTFKGTMQAFKAQLLECLYAGYLLMSRADYVSAMDPMLVKHSETVTPDRLASFHFILTK